MAGYRNNRYQIPTETAEDSQKFKSLCKSILQDQITLIESQGMPFSEVERLRAGITIARIKARQLNKRYRLARNVP